MHLPGPVVSARAFKQSASFRLRSTSNAELISGINVLSNKEEWTVVQVPIPQHAKPVAIFTKKPRPQMRFAEETAKEVYESRYKLPIHKAISNAMQQWLRERGHLLNDD